MTAECTGTKLIIQGLDGRDVVGRFDGGGITSDRGWSLVARRGSDGKPPGNCGRPAARPCGSSVNCAIGRARAGRASVGWWRRKSTYSGERTRDSS